jgi:hypothetical protein
VHQSQYQSYRNPRSGDAGDADADTDRADADVYPDADVYTDTDGDRDPHDRRRGV